jgi:hypothetical protein
MEISRIVAKVLLLRQYSHNWGPLNKLDDLEIRKHEKMKVKNDFSLKIPCFIHWNSTLGHA